MALRLRRGTDTQRQSIIFAEGELIYVTDTKTLFYGDGTTLGGIPVSSSGFNALSTDLDLNSFEINGEGAIDITGTITADIINATQFIGDGSGLTNLPGGNLVEGENYQIGIIGEDSSIIINSSNNSGNFSSLNTKELVIDFETLNSSLSINTVVENSLNGGSSSTLTINGFAGNLENPSIPSNFARSGIDFKFWDGTEFTNSGLISAFYQSSGNGYLTLSVSDTVSGSFSNSIELDGEGIILLNAKKRVEIVNSTFKVSNMTTAERDALTVENGDIIYNSTVNKFQGYQNGTWINLDDGSTS